MIRYSDHLDTLPQHLADQADAAEADTVATIKALAVLGAGDAAELDVDSMDRIIRFLSERLPAPTLCQHLIRTPNQTGVWAPSLHRSEIRCGGCVTSSLGAQLDDSCDLCGQPSTIFHADVAHFGVSQPGGMVPVLVMLEVCPRCHAEFMAAGEGKP